MELSSELQDILAECYRSTKVFAKVFFGERFYAPFSSLHDQIFDLLDSGEQRIAIAAPRGIGKTSMVGLALTAKRILFNDANFLVYVSDSASSAELQTENLKLELASNVLVKQFFGNIKQASATGIDESFSKKAWIAAGKTLVYPRGSGQQVRGILYRNYRPNLIVVDDLEDTDTIDNPEIRKSRKEWFTADLMKCVSRIDKNWQIIYIDTLKHEDSLLQNLLDSPDWCSVRLEICDDNLNPTAPEFMSKEEIEKEYAYHREMGMLDVFFREFRNLPISTDDAIFQQQYFKYYEPADIVDKKHIEYVVICDPAKTIKLHSAESAIVCWGIDRQSNAFYFHDCVSRKMHPDEIYDEIFNMVARNRANVVGLEVTSLNEFITQPFVNEMHKRGIFFDFVELTPRGKAKEWRIAQLASYYRQGHVYHNSTCCQKLESQLMAFPRGKLVDVADAAAYVLQLLEHGNRYFEPSTTNTEDEYAELTYEKPLDGWRVEL